MNDRQKMLEAILARAAVDRPFRRRLLQDPRAAIREAFNLEIPASFRIRFVERDPQLDALVVLPDLRPVAAPEVLLDDELELAAGGATPSCRSDRYRN